MEILGCYDRKIVNKCFFYLLAFVLWSRNELDSFVKMFTSQVFAGKTNFSIVAECVNEARTKCIEVL